MATQVSKRLFSICFVSLRSVFVLFRVVGFPVYIPIVMVILPIGGRCCCELSVLCIPFVLCVCLFILVLAETLARAKGRRVIHKLICHHASKQSSVFDAVEQGVWFFWESNHWWIVCCYLGGRGIRFRSFGVERG